MHVLIQTPRGVFESNEVGPVEDSDREELLDLLLKASRGDLNYLKFDSTKGKTIIGKDLLPQSTYTIID